MDGENKARISDLERWLSPPKGGLWHGGPSVISALRGVKAETAAWRPNPDRHTIWELVLHIAYWKYAIRRRIEDTERGGFPRRPSDWPTQPETPNETAWRADRALLKSEHEQLVALVADFPADRLDDMSRGANQWSFMDLLSGAVLHDTYHVGQIQLMKRLYRAVAP
ncbi:MAG: putative damage-inducible protein DinB [Rhodothermales bacterium]|jgi:uncharacterized damage-inducible protein DinB